MRFVFLLSFVVQIALAVHAYRSGRTTPWVFILLFFPIAGAVLYAVLFLLPELSSGPPATRPFPAEEKALRPVPRGPFANRGDRPDTAIEVDSAGDIDAHVKREDCPVCGSDLRIGERRSETIGERELETTHLVCDECGARPVRYFALRDLPG